MLFQVIKLHPKLDIQAAFLQTLLLPFQQLEVDRQELHYGHKYQSVHLTTAGSHPTTIDVQLISYQP